MLRSIGRKKEGYGGKDLQKMKVLSLECKSGGEALHVCCVRKSRVFQNEGSFLWNLVPHFGLSNFARGASVVANRSMLST